MYNIRKVASLYVHFALQKYIVQDSLNLLYSKNLLKKGGFLLKLRRNRSNINTLYKTQIDNIISRNSKDYLKLFEHFYDLLSNISNDNLRKNILFSYFEIERLLRKERFFMSKLYECYLNLKATETNSNNTLYIFKSGIFFIFLDNDAKIASKLLNLKITYLTEDVIKCGFPINALEKYTNILKRTPYNFKIVDNIKNSIYSVKDYELDQKAKELLSKIANIETNSLSVKEAYDFIEIIKDSANLIIGKDNDNAK